MSHGLIYYAISDGYDRTPQLRPESRVEVRVLTGPHDAHAREWNRQHKLQPKFADVRHDWSLYLDGSLRPKVPIAAVVETWLKNADLALFRHPHRSCAYVEVEACLARKKITRSEADLALDWLRCLESKFTGLKRPTGLYACGMLARRNPAPTALVTLQDRWLKVMRELGIYRDQLFLPYVMAMLPKFRDTRVKVIDADIFDNPWFSYRRHGT